MIGKVLGKRYEIIEKIGGGGMAIVYKAKCALLNRFVAIKVLRPEFINDKDLLDKFRKESQAAASLSHPNIVNVYDVGEEDDIYYIVMEYVDGKTLKEFIKEKGKLNKDEILDFTRQIALALKHAHANHVVHRDIKPHNILITEDHRAKVTDFGIALAATSSTITNTGSIIGSVHYFSPEQARGGYTDEKSDLYSLGIVMYEMATGRLPFEGDAPITIALKHIQENPELPSKYNPSISKELETIIMKLLQKEQINRYANAAALIEDLYKVKNNFDLGDMDNTLRMEDSPTQIIPMVTANEIKELTENRRKDSNNPANKNNREDGKKRKVLIGSAIAAALLAALVFTFAFFYISDFLKTEDVVVPNFVGMTLDEATKEAATIGLKLNVTRKSDDAPKDEVIKQTTAANMKVRKGFEVKITVSEGSELAVVPDLQYKDEADVPSILKNNGLVAGNVKKEPNDLPIGSVIDQNPRAGFRAERGSAVDYVVSEGPATTMVVMPTLEGKTLDEAKAEITKNNLQVGTIDPKYSDVYAAGLVMSQNIVAGTETPEGSVVNLVVSQGPENPDSNEGETEENNNENTPVTKQININLSAFSGIINLEVYEVAAVNNIKIYGKEYNLDNMRPEEKIIKVPVTGVGSKQYTVYINGKLEASEIINF